MGYITGFEKTKGAVIVTINDTTGEMKLTMGRSMTADMPDVLKGIEIE